MKIVLHKTSEQAQFSNYSFYVASGRMAAGFSLEGAFLDAAGELCLWRHA